MDLARLGFLSSCWGRTWGSSWRGPRVVGKTGRTGRGTGWTLRVLYFAVKGTVIDLFSMYWRFRSAFQMIELSIKDRVWWDGMG